jgi:hypothetical protein
MGGKDEEQGDENKTTKDVATTTSQHRHGQVGCPNLLGGYSHIQRGRIFRPESGELGRSALKYWQPSSQNPLGPMMEKKYPMLTSRLSPSAPMEAP